jgi:hypothetical protein
MPLSALFLLMMGAGGWLVYDAVKGKHPWSDFQTALGAPTGLTNATAPQIAGMVTTLGPNGPQYGTPQNPTKAA